MLLVGVVRWRRRRGGRVLPSFPRRSDSGRSCSARLLSEARCRRTEKLAMFLVAGFRVGSCGMRVAHAQARSGSGTSVTSSAADLTKEFFVSSSVVSYCPVPLSITEYPRVRNLINRPTDTGFSWDALSCILHHLWGLAGDGNQHQAWSRPSLGRTELNPPTPRRPGRPASESRPCRRRFRSPSRACPRRRPQSPDSGPAGRRA